MKFKIKSKMNQKPKAKSFKMLNKRYKPSWIIQLKLLNFFSLIYSQAHNSNTANPNNKNASSKSP